MSVPETFVQNAIEAADLMQGYVDICTDKLESLTDEQRAEVGKLVAKRMSSTGAEEAGAIAILNHLLNVEAS